MPADIGAGAERVDHIAGGQRGRAGAADDRPLEQDGAARVDRHIAARTADEIDIDRPVGSDVVGVVVGCLGFLHEGGPARHRAVPGDGRVHVLRGHRHLGWDLPVAVTVVGTTGSGIEKIAGAPDQDGPTLTDRIAPEIDVVRVRGQGIDAGPARFSFGALVDRRRALLDRPAVALVGQRGVAGLVAGVRHRHRAAVARVDGDGNAVAILFVQRRVQLAAAGAGPVHDQQLAAAALGHIEPVQHQVVGGAVGDVYRRIAAEHADLPLAGIGDARVQLDVAPAGADFLDLDVPVRDVVAHREVVVGNRCQHHQPRLARCDGRDFVHNGGAQGQRITFLAALHQAVQVEVAGADVDALRIQVGTAGQREIEHVGDCRLHPRAVGANALVCGRTAGPHLGQVGHRTPDAQRLAADRIRGHTVDGDIAIGRNRDVLRLHLGEDLDVALAANVLQLQAAGQVADRAQHRQIG